jgi:hypothetical protein
MMVLGTSRQGDYASAVWRQLGSALALFGPLYGAQRMLERGSPSKSRLFVERHRRAGEGGRGQCRSNRARSTG